MLENHAHVVFLRLICLHLIPNLCCWIFDFSGANLKEKSESDGMVSVLVDPFATSPHICIW